MAGTGAAHCAATMDLSPYPAETRSLFLHNFTNNSFQPDANIELTDQVRAELARRGNFHLRGERKDAHLWLYGEITVYRKEGRMFDNFRSAIRHELIVACRVRLRRNPTPPDAAPEDSRAASEGDLLASREISASVEYSEEQGFRESEERARRRLFRALAARISDAVEAEYAAHHKPGSGGPPDTSDKNDKSEKPSDAKTN